MSDTVATLDVIVQGTSTNLNSFLAKVESDLQRTAAAADRAGNGIGRGVAGGATQARPALDAVGTAAQRASRESLALASVQARGQAAAGNYAGAIGRLTTAMEGQSVVNLRQAAQIQNQIAQYERAAVAAREKASAEASVATQAGGALAQLGPLVAVVGGGAAVFGVAATAAQSFADAFRFKAELDATTASVRLQLAGVRDANQVFSEAAAFGQKYAFTQGEMARVTQASVGILRQSTSSFTDLAGVLSRLQVLAPGKSIEDAAFSVRELASGDITSIAEQFNISRGKAYEMRDAIKGGADVVQVLADYLQTAGVGMDTLALRTEGAVGQMNLLKQRQEELALAQAEWANGPGMVALDLQTRLTLGLTRALGGGGGLQSALVGLAQQWQNSAVAGSAADRANEAAANVLLRLAGVATDASTQITAVTTAQQQYAAASAALITELQRGNITTGEYAQRAAELAITQQAANNAASIGTGVYDAYAAAAQAAGSANAAATPAVDAATLAIGNQLVQAAAAEQKSRELAEANALIANLGGAVAGGMLTMASAAAQLAAQYGITADQARILIGLQAQIAVQKKFTDQRSAREELRANGGRGGQLSDSAAAFVAEQEAAAERAQEARRNAAGGRRVAGARSTGDQLLKAQQTYQQQSLDSEQQYQDDLARIAEEGAKARLEAQNKYDLGRKRSAVDFYKSLAGFENQDLARDLSARYEAAAAQAQEIARTKGADAAQAYLEAQRSAIEAQGELQNEIAKAEADGDKGKADYYRGLLALQQEADAEELRQITEQGSAVAQAEAAQYTAAEQRYREHLEKMAAAYQEKFGGAPPGLAPPAPGQAQSAALPPPTASQAAAPATATQPVADTTVEAAIAGMQGAVVAAIEGLAPALQAVRDAVQSVERAVSSLKGRSALAP